jgi:hypothetical protein
MRTAPVTATCYAGIYPGRADQVSLVRRAVARHLAGCPAADDMILIVSGAGVQRDHPLSQPRPVLHRPSRAIS